MEVSKFILGCELNRICPNVIIAPCWSPDSVGIKKCELISDKTCKIWRCFIDGRCFTYIVMGVGAANCMDIVFALEKSSCRKLLFLGSAGALKKIYNIGDFAVPKGVISAEGATRYIGNDLNEDMFGRIFYATNEIQKKIHNVLKKIVDKYGVSVSENLGISVESILLQYRHMEELLEMECDFIDMEASAFLAAAHAVKMNAAVVFCISDNICNAEPLYLVAPEKTKFRKKIRKMVMPYVIREFVDGND